MPLDLFVSDQQAALADAAHNVAQDLPAGFGETFDVSLRHASEWSNSLAYSYARERALASYYDDVKAKTGQQLPLYGLGGNVSLDDLNAAQAKIAEAHPDLDLQPLTDNTIDSMTLKRMAAAHDDAAALARRETTWGGTLGSLAGATVGFLSDLPQLALLPLGGAGQLGIAARAMEFAAIGGGSAAITAGLSFSDRERAVPGSATKEIPGEIATATLFGGALGAGFGALGKWLGASAKTLPTAVREDVNAAMSEAQIAANNVFDGTAAEIANRDAVTDAVRSAVRGEPVTSGDRYFAEHVIAYENQFRLPPTVERLSELQLAEIAKTASEIDARAARARALIERRDTAALSRELANVDRATAIDAIKADIAEVQSERDALAARIADARDTSTDDRLAAIEADLAKPGLSARQAAELHQERATIAETLAGAAARDRRELASLEQELSGIDAILRRKMSALGRLQATQERAVSAADRARSGIDAERETVEALLTSQREVVTNEMRRSIAKLAAEGYGVKLDRVEAQRLASLALSRGGAAEDLAQITEMLVSRAREARQTAMAEAAERHLRPLTFAARVDHEPLPRRIPMATGVIEPTPVRAPDLTPEQTAKLAADPQLPEVQQHDLEHIMRVSPDVTYTETVRLPDGSTEQVTRPLREVLAELGEREQAAKELQACVIGLDAAE